MTWRLLVRCEGTPADRDTIALGQCRGFLPVGDPSACTVEELVARLNAGGYRVAADGRHLCPDCARSAS